MRVTARTVIESRWMLEDQYRVLTWARMSYKLAKSQSLVRKKGKVENCFHCKVGGLVVLTVPEKPVWAKFSTAAWKTREVSKQRIGCRSWEEPIAREVQDMDLSVWNATKIVAVTVGEQCIIFYSRRGREENHSLPEKVVRSPPALQLSEPLPQRLQMPIIIELNNSWKLSQD